MQKLHQEANFGTGTLPVFTGESEQRQVGDSQLAGRVDHRPHRILAAPMALEAGQAAPRCPTSVAVHHDRDMARQAGRIQGQIGKII